MIKWSHQVNPYHSNVFALAKISRDELNKKKLAARVKNAHLGSKQADRVCEPEQRFEEELFAHCEHKLDRTPLNEHLKYYERLPITLDDLRTDSIMIRYPLGLIDLPIEGFSSTPMQVSFQLPPNEMEGDTNEGILLDK